jgi:hypothetical protein
MASETKQTKEDKSMAADTTIVAAGGADEPRGERPPEQRGAAPRPSFFAIYKKGQGYWTRMGTALGAGLLGALIIWQIYRQVPAFFADTARGRPRGADRRRRSLPPCTGSSPGG